MTCTMMQIQLVLEKVIEVIKSIYDLIKQTFRSNKGDDDCNDDIDEMYQEMVKYSDEEIYGMQFDLIKDSKLVKETVEEYVHQHWISQTDSHINVILNCKSNEVSDISYIKIQPDRHISFVQTEDKAALITKVAIGMNKVEVTCAHAIEMMGLFEIDKYEMINPMVYCSKRTSVKPELIKLNKYSKMNIVTIANDLNTYYDITTRPIKMINARVMIGSKMKYVTIGAIMQFVEEIKVIYSGSVAMMGDKLFVISSIHRNKKTNVTILVAWAIAEHYIEGTVQ
jgi:hypothetical protein